ncbi:hypothetical protein [Rheinheimera sp.]|uniref:hypothetical protein n=1 Tax=Rheinheimera sp. TaxID=1869214 RepID=UPI0027327834|nr:hypothetical protein [Rheinheimera sp.]MDP2713393.1 hypothetical protein [Rheinheimera sp.]
MNTHADITQKSKTQSAANAAFKKQNFGESTFQFVNNRSEAIAQKKLQEDANNSPQALQSKAVREMVNNNFAQQKQPIQKKENTTVLPDNLKTRMFPGNEADVVQRVITHDSGEEMSYSEMWEEIGAAVDGTPGQALLENFWESSIPYTLSQVMDRLYAHPIGLLGEPSIENDNMRYGALYCHTVVSSTGDLRHLNGMKCREIVMTTSPDINVNAPDIIKEFSIVNNSGQFNDTLFTRRDLVKIIVNTAREQGLHLVRLVSMQTFQWQNNITLEWQDFAKIPIVFGVVRLQSDSLMAYTSSNGKISTEPYQEDE